MHAWYSLSSVFLKFIELDKTKLFSRLSYLMRTYSTVCGAALKTALRLVEIKEISELLGVIEFHENCNFRMEQLTLRSSEAAMHFNVLW